MESEIEILAAGSILIAIFLIIAIVKKNQNEAAKNFLFWGMVIPIIFITLYLITNTVSKNQRSITRGPVHWHADYEIYICGTEELSHETKGVKQAQAHEGEEQEFQHVDLKNPRGISNRIGSSDFHEHGDNRIHVEGVVENLADVSLGKFFEIVGGQLTESGLRLPTNEGQIEAQNGMLCPDGEPGTLQVFLYKTQGKTVIQQKLINFPDYIFSPYSTVPPGDCLIIEFGSKIKKKTEKMCPFYQIAIDQGELVYDRN